MSITIVAMVNNTAINEKTAEISESCLHSFKNSTEAEPYLEHKLVCYLFI